MKTYKIHDSMRIAVAAVRDKLQAVLDLDNEYCTLTAGRREHYNKLLSRAEDIAFAAMYQNTDGRTLKRIADFIRETDGLADKSIYTFA